MSIDVRPDAQMLENTKMVIVDIRTRGEWLQTGVVKNSKCITFFDERGSYNVEEFLKQIDALGGKEQEIGLICRTGSRTSQVANFMKNEGYNVKNLVGGVMGLMQQGYQLVPYQE